MSYGKMYSNNNTDYIAIRRVTLFCNAQGVDFAPPTVQPRPPPQTFGRPKTRPNVAVVVSTLTGRNDPSSPACRAISCLREDRPVGDACPPPSPPEKDQFEGRGPRLSSAARAPQKRRCNADHRGAGIGGARYKWRCPSRPPTDNDWPLPPGRGRVQSAVPSVQSRREKLYGRYSRNCPGEYHYRL